MNSKEPRPLPTHTPGPWKHAHGFITDSDDVILAHVDRRCGTDATVQANAELIARAPELLEDNARLTEKLAKHREYLMDHKAVIEDKRERLRRLRELLQTCKHRLDARWREGTRADSYARGHQDGLEAAEVIFDDVFKAAIEKGE